MRPTPKMTHHAVLRCTEMGIRTRRAKRVVQERTTTYPSIGEHMNGGLVVHSASDTEIAVVWDPATNYILTVLPRVQETYVRTPDGYAIEVPE